MIIVDCVCTNAYQNEHFDIIFSFFVHSSVKRHESELNSITLSEKLLSMSVLRVCALRKPDQIQFYLA